MRHAYSKKIKVLSLEYHHLVSISPLSLGWKFVNNRCNMKHSVTDL